MTWFEILIAVIAITIVAVPIVKKVRQIVDYYKTGKVKCNGSCSSCGCGCAHCQTKPAVKK